MQHRKDTFVRMKILVIEEVDNISNLMIAEPEPASFVASLLLSTISIIF